MPYPHATAKMIRAAPGGPPPPPPPPGLNAAISPSTSQAFRYNGQGGSSSVVTSDTYGCGITGDSGVPVTNPQYTWSAPGCTVNGQGTSLASFSRLTYDNENVNITVSCTITDLDRPGRQAGASANLNIFSAAG